MLLRDEFPRFAAVKRGNSLFGRLFVMDSTIAFFEPLTYNQITIPILEGGILYGKRNLRKSLETVW